MENRAQVTFADVAASYNQAGTATRFRLLTGIPRAGLLDLQVGDIDAGKVAAALICAS